MLFAEFTVVAADPAQLFGELTVLSFRAQLSGELTLVAIELTLLAIELTLVAIELTSSILV